MKKLRKEENPLALPVKDRLFLIPSLTLKPVQHTHTTHTIQCTHTTCTGYRIYSYFISLIADWYCPVCSYSTDRALLK